MDYSDQTVKVIAVVIEDLRENTLEKGAKFAQRYFLHKLFKGFGQEGRDVLTKDMDQLYRRTCFWPISIKYLAPQEKRRTQENIMILEQKSTKKTQRRNGVQWKTNWKVTFKG